MNSYTFRPATAADLPMLRRWLLSPEVVRWWGDPDIEYATLAEDLTEPGMTMLIVEVGGFPFAYAQHYEVHTWPQPHLVHLPAGSRAIDTFIGVAEMIGQGHGAAYLGVLAAQLRGAGAPTVAIDPHVDNERAQRANAKAGFRLEREVETEGGRVALMIYGDGA